MPLVDTDELEHGPTGEWPWRESLYFSFHDANGSVGGSTTIGVRPNQNSYEALAILFLNSRCQVLLYHARGDLGEGRLHAAPGIEYEVVEPLCKWRVAIEAGFFSIEQDAAEQGLVGHKDAVPITWCLDFDAVHPAFAFPAQALGKLGIGAAHYEQCGRIEGTVSVAGEALAVRGLGFRDHSWGVRDLVKAGDMRTLLAQFGPDLVATLVWGKAEGQEMCTGYVWHSGANDPVIEAHILVDADPLELPTAACATAVTAAGHRLSLQAEVQAVMPIVLDQEKVRLCWYECSAQIRGGDRSGYGILEMTSLVNYKRSGGLQCKDDGC